MEKALLFKPLNQYMFLSAFVYILSLSSLSAAVPTLVMPIPDTDSVRQQRTYLQVVCDNNGSSTSLSYNGKIVFTEDERDIKSITPGGFFKYSKTTFGNCREIHVISAADGALTRRYYVGRTQQPYEPEGRQWLQEMLPGIIATTGIGAEDRVERLFAKSGVNGVLNQIAKIESDQVQSIYLSYLISQPSLKDNELRHVLAQVNKYIESDYEKGKLLRKTGPQFLQNEKVTQEYLQTVATMSSDYEKGKVLTYLLQNGKLKPANISQVVNSISRISSSFEQAKVLKQVVVYPTLPQQNYKEVIAQAAAISADYEKTKILATIMANPKFVDQHFDEILTAIRSIRSDYEKSRALAYLVTKRKLTTDDYLQVFPVVADINSSYEKSRTLQKLKTNMPTDNSQVRAAYAKTARTISSDFEYRRVMDGLD
jgi:DNA-directed RNA polymerase subunit F